ncbi:MAG: hypothetical protein NC111_06620 [Bacteroides sp.]|nr:hypothetical protein [Bacteroides sp.]MCM1413080.1 hypothetical protein [Bacteroides sp.]MCM1472178.1 hypothetical protein [Bacteroides sp.]
MERKTQRLPGVKFIGLVDADNLQRNNYLCKITGQRTPVLTSIEQVFFSDEPDCRCKTEYLNGGYQETATLKFLSTTLLPMVPGKNYGFVVTDIEDNSYLIGSVEPPHVTFECEMRCSAPDGDGGGFYYEIKHCQYRTLTPCVISTERKF